MTTANLVEIYCIFDDFCKIFEPELKKHMIDMDGKAHRNRPCRVSDAEIMTMLVLFHTSHFRDLKTFYTGYVCQHLRQEFPNNFLLSFRRTSKESSSASANVPKHLCLRQMYRHIHYRLYSYSKLSHQTHAYAQDNEGTCSNGEMHYGMVLWFQTPSCHQR